MHVNVEIQLISQYNMIKRTIFYMAKMLISQLAKGEDYSCLNRTVTINILNFNYINRKGALFLVGWMLFLIISLFITKIITEKEVQINDKTNCKRYIVFRTKIRGGN
jgi:predicted transposase/invertase (TIGR01784 family)